MPGVKYAAKNKLWQRFHRVMQLESGQVVAAKSAPDETLAADCVWPPAGQIPVEKNLELCPGQAYTDVHGIGGG